MPSWPCCRRRACRGGGSCRKGPLSGSGQPGLSRGCSKGKRRASSCGICICRLGSNPAPPCSSMRLLKGRQPLTAVPVWEGTHSIILFNTPPRAHHTRHTSRHTLVVTTSACQSEAWSTSQPRLGLSAAATFTAAHAALAPADHCPPRCLPFPARMQALGSVSWKNIHSGAAH